MRVEKGKTFGQRRKNHYALKFRPQTRSAAMLLSMIVASLCASLALAAPTTYDQLDSTSHLGQSARRDADLGKLVLIVKAQDDVNDPDDLTVSACLINTGDKTLKILNDPNGSYFVHPDVSRD